MNVRICYVTISASILNFMTKTILVSLSRKTNFYFFGTSLPLHQQHFRFAFNQLKTARIISQHFETPHLTNYYRNVYFYFGSSLPCTFAIYQNQAEFFHFSFLCFTLCWCLKGFRNISKGKNSSEFFCHLFLNKQIPNQFLW